MPIGNGWAGRKIMEIQLPITMLVLVIAGGCIAAEPATRIPTRSGKTAEEVNLNDGG
jgi:hypothetical protein